MRCLFLVFCSATLAAQSPLTPTANSTIDVDPTLGVLHYSSIDIPAGVTVTFTGSHPVQIYCDGDAVIDGGLSVDSPPPQWGVYVIQLVGGPGAVWTAAGVPGASYSWWSPLGQLWCSSPTTVASDGQHLGVYGSAMPFGLEGGSPGGSFLSYSEFGGTGQCWLNSTSGGGGGGGTLFLEAGGSVTVTGSVTADGAYAQPSAGSGAGGSILLRGLAGLTIQSSALVSAVVTQPGWPAVANGIIRLDSYGQPPVIQGTVMPAPMLIELPFLEEVQPPTLGATWELRVVAPRGGDVVLAASYQPGSFTLLPFGTIGIDVLNSTTLDVIAMPATGHDPMGFYQLPVPNVPALIGLDIYTAGLSVQPAPTPRFTNTIHSVVQ